MPIANNANSANLRISERLSFKEAKDKVISLFHAQYIRLLLRESNGNISRAAEQAGIQRQYLHRLMKESGVEAEGFRHKSE